MVNYDAPDGLLIETIALADLPSDWRRREGLTQSRGDAWHRTRSTALLRVTSAIVPLTGSPDLNVVVNHMHPAASDIRTRTIEPYVLDPRLF
jgi:hypothetical protein